MAARTIIRAALVAGILCSAVRAADWPTYRHDNQRTGATPERLDAPKLRQQWLWRSPHPPQPAWAGPAKWDAYHNIRKLRSMRNYDPVFHLIAVGDAVYFGSSADDAVRCLDARTGAVRWFFHADGPVRLPPSFADGKLYFGSDDGTAYCIRASDGRPVWTFTPSPRTRLLLNNGRLVSYWPIRTGVAVDGGAAYFAAALLPWRPSYLCAVDAATGKPQGPGRYVVRHDGLTPEGPLLLSSACIISPQGRVPPLLFQRADGHRIGGFRNGGGTMVVLAGDQLLYGPGNKTGWLTASNVRTREKLASFPGANAAVAAGESLFVVTDRELIAFDQASRKPRWRTSCECPNELILAGDVLFAGGDGQVLAFSASDGRLVWEHAVEGRAYGLVVANGALFVSTDEGLIHCFRPTGVGRPRAVVGPEAPTRPQASGPVIGPNKDQALLARWVFHRSQAFTRRGKPATGVLKGAHFKPLAGKLPAAVLGNPRIVQLGEVEAVQLNGKTDSLLVTPDIKRAPLPRREMTVEAWVRVDKPLEWGGIVGVFQDNGSYERGWLLGFRNNRFTFALAAKSGAAGLGYLDAKAPFAPGRWYHVVGTYDGATKRIFVNGKLEAATSAQKGDILYPPKAWFEIGAYHDDNEYFRTTGMVHEVCLYRRAMDPGEVARRYAKGRERFAGPPRFPLGPIAWFEGRDAVVRWRTSQPSPTILAYGIGAPTRKIEDPKPKTDHLVRLPRLRRNRVYAYRIETLTEGLRRRSPIYELDTFFNYTVPALPERPNPYGGTNEAGRTAQRILEATGIRAGICVVMDCGDGRLAYELARRSRLRIIGLETDPEAVAAARRALARAGAYGVRVAVRRVGSLSDLPLPSCFADLVVGGPENQARRLLRPGGIAWLGEGRTVKRPPLPGAGEWTHQYGRADNSAFGGEALGGARSTADLVTQWVSRPGPRYQADRNGRKPSPLAANGRLFLQGLERIIAVNAYNGTVLWSRELPGFLRFNVPRDCSNWCADDSSLYVAIGGKVHRLDAATGAVSRSYDVVPGPKPWEWDWGFVGRVGDILFGSAVKRGTAYKNFWGDPGWYDQKVAPKVCSDNLFALDVATGRPLWSRSQGVVVNSTITVADGRVHFVECRNPEVRASEDRRVAMHELWQSQFLTTLDARSGKLLWEKYIDVVDGLTVLYLACGEGKLVLLSSGSGTYHVWAFDARDGKDLWEARFPWPGDNHGAHMSRPAIVAGRVFVRPRVFDLATGKPVAPAMPKGGCGTYAATSRTLIFRAGSVALWEFESGRATRFPRLRPDCWLSTIPACGMLLSPEGGGGCSCGSWMETSVGFLPRAFDHQGGVAGAKN